MKFNWGTGIFLFLLLFLLGSAVFITFAVRQQVNLVHKDYYEQGVDYTEQMRVRSRSKAYGNALKTSSNERFFIVDIDESLISRIDSGTIHMFRPSDYTKDIQSSFLGKESTDNLRFEFDKQALISGRYILKFSWYAGGVKYEIERPVNVQ
ncbi:FixH family protein [uncultured Draconibacterium sp.]|uniref:FixH family protein n=1 Tax=uncultured Draconibacterium sp. TaxID=1573823 RepID=UPI0025FB0A1C|nr:FixH family protein [uncultured Draconibacterium sp.]